MKRWLFSSVRALCCEYLQLFWHLLYVWGYVCSWKILICEGSFFSSLWVSNMLKWRNLLGKYRALFLFSTLIDSSSVAERNMFLCIPTAVSKACGKHTSQFVWRRLCRCEWWGWDRCRLLSSHWSFQQSVWRNWAWVKIKMRAWWKGVWRSPEYFVVECTTRSISSCQCLISEWLTCSLCYCYTVSIKHLEATAVEICFYINAFEFTERLFHCVRITFLF